MLADAISDLEFQAQKKTTSPNGKVVGVRCPA